MSSSIAGGTNISVEKLESAAREEERVIDEAIAVSLKSISANCQDRFSENCLETGMVKQEAFAEMMKMIMSKQEMKIDDKQIEGYHLEVKKFIGRPGITDYQELGIKHLKQDIPKFSPDNLKKVQIAAGKAVINKNVQSFNIDGKCYDTQYENGRVGVIESACK